MWKSFKRGLGLLKGSLGIVSRLGSGLLAAYGIMELGQIFALLGQWQASKKPRGQA